MAKFSLQAVTPLGGFEQTLGQVQIAEVTGLAVVSVACPLQGEKALQAALQAAYQVELPVPGATAESAVDQLRLLGLQRDQWFALFAEPPAPAGAVPLIAERLGDTAYFTDQSDSWVMLRVSGADTRRALERICMLDLHPDVFTPGKVARTQLEHLNALMLCEGEEQFLLMGARSSAEDFLHALVVSARNIL